MNTHAQKSEEGQRGEGRGVDRHKLREGRSSDGLDVLVVDADMAKRGYEEAGSEGSPLHSSSTSPSTSFGDGDVSVGSAHQEGEEGINGGGRGREERGGGKVSKGSVDSSPALRQAHSEYKVAMGRVNTRYAGAMATLLLLVFSSVVKGVFDLLLCVPVGDIRVLFYAPDVECYAFPFMIAQVALLLFVLVLLLPAPFLLILISKRLIRRMQRHEKEEEKEKKEKERGRKREGREGGDVQQKGAEHGDGSDLSPFFCQLSLTHACARRGK
uniref:Uncharacterized protein n=1 Tax=Palpitomonas bilix TaxID=652834 RepID=A0A7S3GHC3_9EUKA